MRIGSLFSGGGLGDLGFVMAGCEIVAQVEIDEYCQKILKMRYPDAKKFRDIRSVKGSELPECDIITGGFPCQPFSVAGKQRGKYDDRHLWPEMFRIISEVRPTWVIGENVSGFVRIALDDVLNDLESIGYEATTLVFPAHALGAPHRRERAWIVGNSDGGCGNRQKHQIRAGRSVIGVTSENVADANSERPQGSRSDNDQERREGPEQRPFGLCDIFTDWWSTEPAVGRVVNGCPRRVDRLKCLGNGQVPYCTKWIAEKIMEFENSNLLKGGGYEGII